MLHSNRTIASNVIILSSEQVSKESPSLKVQKFITILGKFLKTLVGKFATSMTIYLYESLVTEVNAHINSLININVLKNDAITYIFERDPFNVSSWKSTPYIK